MSGLIDAVQITTAERLALGHATGRWCECELESPFRTCPAHLMFSDENLLKHLVFVHRVAKVYIDDEFIVKAK